MTTNIYGYARVSTKEQNEERQVIALIDSGVSAGFVYVDKQSGKDFERIAFKQLMEKLKPGDTLIIKSIDRLGRNFTEILEQWQIITREKKVNIVILDMPLLDTRKKTDSLGTLITNIALLITSYQAQSEREFIRQRQTEGIFLAKQRGVKFGRPRKEKPKNFEIMRSSYKIGQISSRQAAKKIGVAQSTFLNWCHEISTVESV